MNTTLGHTCNVKKIYGEKCVLHVFAEPFGCKWVGWEILIRRVHVRYDENHKTLLVLRLRKVRI